MAINEDFLSRLEEMLNREAQWPKVYMFKFIVLNNNRDYAILRKFSAKEPSCRCVILPAINTSQ